MSRPLLPAIACLLVAGTCAMDFNGAGMLRAARDSRGRRQIGVYQDLQP